MNESWNPINSAALESCFNHFISLPEQIELPEKFTFPFCYDPHPLALLAAKELQEHLLIESRFPHNFGLNDESHGVGKMFGVLVVQKKSGELGYLAAFSGKLCGSNHHTGFVPPVFDTLKKDGFYKLEEAKINEINKAIADLESSEMYQAALSSIDIIQSQAQQTISALKLDIKQSKTLRKQKRLIAFEKLSVSEIKTLNELLDNESKHQQIKLKKINREWKALIAEAQAKLQDIELKIDLLKAERRQKSAMLQHKLFESYYFLNILGEKKDLTDIFQISEENTPPSGAGECAAPKLLQYAFIHQLKPVTMAEFWWGKSPTSEIRKHGYFYPACKSKCEPILGHMLAGITLDDNPLKRDFSSGKEVPIIWEDDYLAIVNKPTDFLSVPGKEVTDSVYERVKNLFPKATGPLIVHRLDMSTSGIMVIAKTVEAYRLLQRQFIKRLVKKRYVAILDGVLQENQGDIQLPIRVDLDDRPRQLVCYEYGKPAHTRWKVHSVKDQKTKVYFYPITGRTHQLRVHASHSCGLDIPILGDDLYGKKSDRLYLHAESIEFTHPILQTTMKLKVKADF